MLEKLPAQPATIYMLRTAQQRHTQLSAMADQKANIIIGASLIMVTLIIGQAAKGSLSIPMWVLGSGAAIACAFAMLAVLPTVTSPKPGSPGFNPLFFGAVSQLSVEEYMQQMLNHLGSEQTVYELMLRDMHCEAQVLARKKYRRLRISYIVFLTTLALTISLAVIVHFLPQ